MITDAYISSLEGDDELLNNLIKSKVDEGELNQVLTDVKEDLEIKLAYLNRGSFIKKTTKVHSPYSIDPHEQITRVETQIGDVAVTVQTKHSDSSLVRGYEIWYVSWGNRRVPSQFLRFSTQSTTDPPENLAPGKYAMWTLKDGKTTPISPISIGTQGAEQSVDLSVPDN